MQLKIIDHPFEWDRFVMQHPGAAFTHLFGWRRVIAPVYRHKPVYLAAVEKGRIVALVPLFRFSRLFYPPEWISVPFFDHAGILAKNPKAGQFLLEKAWDTLGCRNSAGLSIRQNMNFDASELTLQGRRPQIFTEKTGLTIALAPNPHRMMATFPAKLRSQINKGIKNGLTWDIGGPKLLPAFYKVFAQNMRDLGSPVHALYFFKTIFSVFPGRAFICVIYHRGMPAAASFVFRFKNRLVNPWASSLKEFRSLNTNMLLYWQMIRLACGLNLDIFDMGRSSKGASTFRFKQQWGPKQAAQIIQQGSEYLEVALHGVGHEFWDRGQMFRSEFHDPNGKMRPQDLVKKHLEYFFRLMEAFSLAQAPRIFIPPALHHGFGKGVKGFQAIARSFGIRYIPLVFSRADCRMSPQFKGLGWEEGVLLMERGVSQTRWNHVAAPPEFSFNSPILALHWANIIHPDPGRNMDVIHAWAYFIKKRARENQVVLSRDISACLTQYLNATQSRIQAKKKKIVVSLDWIDKVPAKALSDTLFFSLDLPKGVALRLSGAKKKDPRNQDEARFIKTGMPKAGKIVFEYHQPS